MNRITLEMNIPLSDSHSVTEMQVNVKSEVDKRIED